MGRNGFRTGHYSSARDPLVALLIQEKILALANRVFVRLDTVANCSLAFIDLIIISTRERFVTEKVYRLEVF